MVFFIVIIGVVIILAVGIVGFLMYLLNKESKDPEAPGSGLVGTSASDPLTGSIPTYNPQGPDPAQLSREFAEKEATYQNKVETLQVELTEISQKAQSQSQEALMTIEQLRQENEQLKNEKNNPSMVGNEGLAQAQQTIESLHQEQSMLQTRLSESSEQAQKLQEEVVAIRQQMGQEILQGREETEKLIADNQNLKASLEPMIAEATKNLQDEIGSLRQENQTLKDAAGQAVIASQPACTVEIEEAAKLQDTVDELRIQIQALKNTNNDLILANQGLKISLESSSSEADSHSQEIEKLKQEIENVKNTFIPAPADNDLLLANQRIKELTEQNEHLTERSETLQWDLTKARAQMTSFERACENYQLQLKEALDKNKGT